jgi:hypothetical protein
MRSVTCAEIRAKIEEFSDVEELFADLHQVTFLSLIVLITDANGVWREGGELVAEKGRNGGHGDMGFFDDIHPRLGDDLFLVLKILPAAIHHIHENVALRAGAKGAGVEEAEMASVRLAAEIPNIFIETGERGEFGDLPELADEFLPGNRAHDVDVDRETAQNAGMEENGRAAFEKERKSAGRKVPKKYEGVETILHQLGVRHPQLLGNKLNTWL